MGSLVIQKSLKPEGIKPKETLYHGHDNYSIHRLSYWYSFMPRHMLF